MGEVTGPPMWYGSPKYKVEPLEIRKWLVTHPQQSVPKRHLAHRGHEGIDCDEAHFVSIAFARHEFVVRTEGANRGGSRRRERKAH